MGEGNAVYITELAAVDFLQSADLPAELRRGRFFRQWNNPVVDAVSPFASSLQVTEASKFSQVPISYTLRFELLSDPIKADLSYERRSNSMTCIESQLQLRRQGHQHGVV